jgi:hypothetical protein
VPTTLALHLFLDSNLILHQPSQMPKFIMKSSTVILLTVFPLRNLLGGPIRVLSFAIPGMASESESPG